ncbi:MAG: hypothetical protein WCK51_10080 [Armatimonadota bacterium]
MKRERILVVVASVLFGTLGYFLGLSQGKSVSLDEAVVKRLTSDRAITDSELIKTKSLIAANKDRLELLDSFNSKVEKARNDLATAEKLKKEADQQMVNKKSELSEKQREWNRLTQKIERKLAEPTELPAGRFTVGSDIQGGRYRVTGSSNFVVRTSDGDLKVNTILGDSGNDSYVCRLDDGDEIQAESRILLYPL